MSEQKSEWQGYAILELLGHRKLAGYVKAETLAGTSFLRVDVPGDDGTVCTQFVNPASVYALTPTTEDIANRFAAGCRPEPVTPWELRERTEEPKALPSEGHNSIPFEDDDDDPYDPFDEGDVD